MKAIVYEQYGSPGVLQLKEVPKPTPGDKEVLVKVHAASINSMDWDMLRGKPKIYRLIFGLLKPKHKIIGSDIAGRVEAVGNNVKQFHAGDEVFGDLSGCSFGAFAEYVCAPEQVLAEKPAGMTFEEAAAIPQAGVLALQGLRQGQIQQGTKVLINGAGGGVGTFAVQLAKYFGAEVTGVDSTGKLDMLQSFGADHVIDYTKIDFTKNGQHYDLIIEVVADRSIAAYKRTLSKNGIGVIIGGVPARLLQIALLGGWVLGDKKMSLLMHKSNKEDLNYLNKLFEAGKVVPVVDKCYALSEVPEALRYFGEGNAKGKVVITV